MTQESQQQRCFGDDAVEPIAVIGMACRFPGDATDIASFWEMITAGRNANSKVPASRYNVDAYYHPSNDRRGSINTKNGYFLKEDPGNFDAPFFNLTMKEASGMDPMHRLTMEVAYEGLENAGIPISTLPKSNTSVFHGCFTGDYASLANGDIYDSAPYQATGNGLTMLSNRLSWFFDLRGPSMTIDTACSSSLYAIHLACQSLRSGESEMSIVSASNMILYPNMMASLTAAHFLGPDGISRSFDARASGYARGEAIGAVILKPLSKALADGDTIRSIIRGTGANQDGKTPGITQPSSEAQAELITNTYKRSGLNLADTGFFECHGTGTAVGDPLELSAIGATMGAARDADQQPLYLGSVKTNIGHTEGCSGLAGLIKSVLCLEHGKLPPNSGFETLNPKLKLEEWNLALPKTTMPWPSSGLRRACINSFGYGGSNAVAVIDDAYHYLTSRGLTGNHHTFVSNDSDSDEDSGFNSPATTTGSEVTHSAQYKLFPFSTSDEAGLKRMSETYHSHLAARLDQLNAIDITEDPDWRRYFDNLAYTLASRRTTLDYRSFAVAPSVSKLTHALESGLPKQKKVNRKCNAIWVFTGQGAQYAEMGKELIANDIFRSSLHRSQVYLDQNGCTWDVIEELEKTKSESRIDQPEFSQPVCTILQIALVDLITYWGLTPTAVVGHSSGEVAAAYAAHGISHQDAVKIAFQRGIYSKAVLDRQASGPGGMAAVGLSAEDVQPHIDQLRPGALVVACINSPSSVTVSGDLDMIDALEAKLKAESIFVRKLRVLTAYHSHHMKTIAEEYKSSMGTINPLKDATAAIPMFSSVTGSLVASPMVFTAEYWVDNLVSPVKFVDACKALLTYSPGKSRRKTPISYNAVVEIGPGEGLKGPLNQILTSVDAKFATSVPYSSVIKRGEDAEAVSATTAGKLWSQGFPVNIARVNGLEEEHSLKTLPDLPSYPWNHTKRYWHEPAISKAKRNKKHPRTDLLGVSIDAQNPMEPRWRNFLTISEQPWLEHHRITEATLFPGAGMLIMAIEAAKQIADESRELKGFELREITFERGLLIPSADEAVETSLNFHVHSSEDGKTWWRYTIFSLPTGGEWVKHHSGLISILYKDEPRSLGQISEANEEWKTQTEKYQFLKDNGSVYVTGKDFYTGLENAGMQYGTLFTNVTEAYAAPGTLSGHGTIRIPDTKSAMPHEFEYPHMIHPATLDAIFHLLFVGFREGKPLHRAGVPYCMESMYISADLPVTPGEEFKAYAVTDLKGERESIGSIVVSDSQWSEPMIVINRFAAREVTSGARDGPGSGDHKICSQIQWQEDADHLTGASALQLLKTAGSDSKTQLDLWLKKLCFKSSQLDALILADQLASFETVLSKFGPQSGQRFRFNKLSIVAHDEEAKESAEKQISALEIDAEIKLIKADELKTLEGSYDLIIADKFNSIALDLEHTKTLLSESGKLVMHLDHTVFNKQTDLLQSGLELKFDSVTQDGSLVVASKSVARSEIKRAVLICSENETENGTTLRENLTERLESQNVTVVVSYGIPATVEQEDVIISLMEIEQPWVVNWVAKDLENFQKLVFSAGYMLWLTRGGQMLQGGNVDYAASTGLLRTIRTEVPQITLAHLDFSEKMDITSELAHTLVLNILNSTLNQTDADNEFAELEGTIWTPRIVENTSFDRELAHGTAGQKPVPGYLSQSTEALQLIMATPGLLDSSFWNPIQEAETSIAEDEVEIATSAYGLNAVDYLAASGDTQFTKLGYEASGTVTKVGSSVTKLQVGQKVATIGLSSLRTQIKQRQDLVVPVPSSMDLVSSAGLGHVFTTAYHAINQLAHLEQGESILITSAAGGIGQACVQLAKHIGAEIFVTVGTEDKKKTMIQHYNIPEDHIFMSQDHDLAKGIKRMTSGQGADVIVSFNTGEKFRHTWTSIAPSGRYIDLTLNTNSSNLIAKQFDHNAAFFSVNMHQLFNTKPAKVSKAFNSVFELFEAGILKNPFPLEVFDACDAGKAFQKMQNGKHIGKFILNLESTKAVPMMASAPEPLKLDPTATYVLSGGLGGLGPSLAQTMIDAGARSLAFLSRSGASTEGARQILNKFRNQGCEAEAFACDVSKKEAVQEFVRQAYLRGWKVKGLIQCAMVLRDSTFDNMNFEKWDQATKPKIQGTWNLHELLPTDMDFFIMLSSVVGIIGNAAQANYIAGNTYMDALAHLRRSQGQSAVSLDVGVVSDSGHFTDDVAFDHFLDKFPHLAPLQMTTPELNRILATLLKGKTMDGEPTPAQLITGINDQLSRDVNITSVWAQDRKFDHRLRLDASNESSSTAVANVSAQIKAAKTLTEAGAAVEASLQHTIATAMSTTPEEIDVDLPLNAFGIDSLKAVEVRNWVYRELAADVSVFEILAAVPMKKLAMQIAKRSKLLDPKLAGQADGADDAADE